MNPATSTAHRPKTSCLINNYNYENFVCEAVASALAQTVPFDEIIVVDDGSTDGSVARLQAAFGSNPTVKIISKPNGGQLSAFNRGFSESTGDLLFFLDADDLYTPAMLEKTLEAYQRHPQAGLVFGPVRLFDQIGGIDFVRTDTKSHHIQFLNETSCDNLPAAAKQEILFGGGKQETLTSGVWTGSPTSAVSLQRSTLERFMPLPCEAQWRTRADDCLLFGAALLDVPRYYQPEPLVHYRIHGNNAWFSGKSPTPEQEQQRRLDLMALFTTIMRQIGDLAPDELMEHFIVNRILREYENAFPFSKRFRRGRRAFRRAGLPKSFVQDGQKHLLKNAFKRLLGMTPGKP